MLPKSWQQPNTKTNYFYKSSILTNQLTSANQLAANISVSWIMVGLRRSIFVDRYIKHLFMIFMHDRSHLRMCWITFQKTMLD